MSKIHQYRVGQEKLYFLYRFIILPWELEWQSQQFSTNIGNLKKYEKDSGLVLKCFENISKLEVEAKNYPKSYKKTKGILLFNKTENKPKCLLRHLRNLSAHGHFKMVTINKTKCIRFKHHSKKDDKLRVIGHLPFDELKPLIKAIMTTRKDDHK